MKVTVTGGDQKIGKLVRIAKSFGLSVETEEGVMIAGGGPKITKRVKPPVVAPSEEVTETDEAPLEEVPEVEETEVVEETPKAKPKKTKKKS